MIRLRIALLSVLVFVQAINGQSTDIFKGFREAVSLPLRESFIRALQSEVNAQELRDWNALFDLQWPPTLEHRTRQQYQSTQNGIPWNLKDFRIIRIDAVTKPYEQMSAGQWTILGCARIEENGRIQAIESATDIYLVDGKWYSGEIRPLIAMDRSRNSFTKCRIAEGIDPKNILTNEK
jgi:hypothetical protein